MPPDAATENEHVDTRAGGGGGTKWEVRTDIYALPCVKQLASGKLPCSTGGSAGCSVMSYQGGIGEWEGGSQGRGICMHVLSVAQSCSTLYIQLIRSVYNRNQYNIIKK